MGNPFSRDDRIREEQNPLNRTPLTDEQLQQWQQRIQEQREWQREQDAGNAERIRNADKTKGLHLIPKLWIRNTRK